MTQTVLPGEKQAVISPLEPSSAKKYADLQRQYRAAQNFMNSIYHTYLATRRANLTAAIFSLLAAYET